MNSQDQRQITSSGHEGHGSGTHLCHKCGWPFPNPHPSAKHRRAHKRVCGKVEGYKLIDSDENTHLTISDDERPSDEDRKTPSPKIVVRSKNENGSGGFGERSKRSEDDVFSDAVMDFSDPGFSPSSEELLEEARKSSAKVEKIAEDDTKTAASFNDAAITDLDICQSLKDPTDNCKIQNPQALESELVTMVPKEHISCTLDSVASLNPDVGTEESAFRLDDKRNGSESDPIKLENPKETLEGNISANVGDSVMPCIGLETDAKGDEEKYVDSTLIEIAVSPNKDSSEASKADGKAGERNAKTFDALLLDTVIESKKVQTDGLGPRISSSDHSVEVQSFNLITDTIVNTASIDVDTAQEINVGSHAGLFEGSIMSERDRENVHLLLVPDDMHVNEHPGTMLEDFKDLRVFKSTLPLVIDSGEAVRVEDDTEALISIEKPSLFQSCELCESLEGSSVHKFALKDTLREDEGIKLTVENSSIEEEADIPNLKVLSSENPKSVGAEATLVDPRIEIELEKSRAIYYHEEQEPHDSFNDSPHKILPEQATAILSETNHLVSPMDAEVNELVGDVNAKDRGNDQIRICDTAGHDTKKEVPTCEKFTMNTKASSDLASNLSKIEANCVTNLLGADAAADQNVGCEKGGFSVFEISKETVAEISTMSLIKTPESVSSLSEIQAMDDGRVYSVNHLQESESTYLETAGNDVTKMTNITKILSNLQNPQDKVTTEGVKDILIHSIANLQESVGALNEVAKSNQCDGVELSQNSSEHVMINEMKVPSVAAESSVESFSAVRDNQDRELGEGASGINADYLQEEGETDHIKQALGGSAAYILADSSSQTDSPSVAAESSVESFSAVRDNQDRELGVGASHIHADYLQEEGETDPIKQPLSGSAAHILADSSSQTDSPSVAAKSSVESFSAVRDNQGRELGEGASGINADYLQEEGEPDPIKQQLGGSAADILADSSSQTDSLEGNWGSASVLSTLSDTPAAADAEALPSNDSQTSAEAEKANMRKQSTASEGHHSDKSDTFEPPSFLTLVELNDQKPVSSEIQTVQNPQQPNPASLQAGWFPSLTHVANESPGRKKNEEIIAKVTNLITRKQHTPLKSLLGEANVEGKMKSPNPKENPIPITKKDETLAKGDGTAMQTVSSFPSHEVPQSAAAKTEMPKEWNSPARYPADIKREKRKPYWAQFVCCSSVN